MSPDTTVADPFTCPDCDAEFRVGEAVPRPRCPVCLGTRVRPVDAPVG